MAFFDEVGKRLTKAGQGMAQSTKNMASIAKLSSAISDEEKKIKNLYTLIGQTYFNSHRDTPENEQAASVNAIIESAEKIAQYKEEMQRIRGITNCPNCGAEVPFGVAFCNACGNKMPAPTYVADVANTSTCPSCGASVTKGQKFCAVCGTQIPENHESAHDIVCSNCGAHLSSDTEFCLECGQPVH